MPIEFSPEHLRPHVRSLVRPPTRGFQPYSRDALLATVPEAERDAYAAAADAWVTKQGGGRFSVQMRSSRALLAGRAVAPPPPPRQHFYELPPDALGG